jgi:dehydrogenase/reductase SDR family protein 7B
MTSGPTLLRRAVQGRVAWVTGASSGIGEELAVVLAAAGASVVLSARREDQLQRVARRCGEAMVLPFDLTDPQQIDHAADRVLAEKGRVDVLVLCAGVSQRSLALDTRPSVYRRLMEIDFFGPVTLTQRVLPSMVQQGKGSIVVVSSVAGKLGTPMRTGYAAAKHALHGYFDSLRAELHDRGLRVTIACPGYVQTEITMHSLTGDGTPYGRVDASLREGVPVPECAARILDAMARERSEVVVSGLRERVAVLLKRAWPSLLDVLVRRERPE